MRKKLGRFHLWNNALFSGFRCRFSSDLYRDLLGHHFSEMKTLFPNTQVNLSEHMNL